MAREARARGSAQTTCVDGVERLRERMTSGHIWISDDSAMMEEPRKTGGREGGSEGTMVEGRVQEREDDPRELSANASGGGGKKEGGGGRGGGGWRQNSDERALSDSGEGSDDDACFSLQVVCVL